MPCFCRFIAFFVSSHVNLIGNSVYTLCIYVKGVLTSISSNVEVSISLGARNERSGSMFHLLVRIFSFMQS